MFNPMDSYTNSLKEAVRDRKAEYMSTKIKKAVRAELNGTKQRHPQMTRVS